MLANRLVITMTLITLLLQGAILYRQYQGSALPTSGPVSVPIKDAPAGLRMKLAGLPIQGSADAKVALIEFSDYECPFCARYANEVADGLRKEFVSTGKIRYAFANNPLPIHPNAKSLATAALCAGEQDSYWPLHDKLFHLQPKTKTDVLTIVENLHLNPDKFQQCMEESSDSAKRIQEDMQTAIKLGLTATPSFAVGAIDTDGYVSVKKFIVGAQALTIFQRTLNEVLQKQRPQ